MHKAWKQTKILLQNQLYIFNITEVYDCCVLLLLHLSPALFLWRGLWVKPWTHTKKCDLLTTTMMLYSSWIPQGQPAKWGQGTPVGSRRMVSQSGRLLPRFWFVRVHTTSHSVVSPDRCTEKLRLYHQLCKNKIIITEGSRILTNKGSGIPSINKNIYRTWSSNNEQVHHDNFSNIKTKCCVRRHLTQA